MTGPAIEDLASVLRGTEADLVGAGTDGPAIEQIGGAVLAEPLPVPVPGPQDPVAPRGGEATIETFVVDGTGPAQCMGSDEAVADWWRPTVEILVDRVRTGLAPLEVELAGPIYVTASATTLGQVIDEPHLDDDQYHPDAGVGLVAIAASHRGPRLARGVLGCQRVMPGAPLALDPDALTSWFDNGSGDSDEGDGDDVGGRRVQETPADRVVLFPRFGQLHAGPVITSDAGSDQAIRNLLVLRADTVARQPRSGSGPT